ncbi:MAG: hypothetical protein MJ204_03785 [Bacteroidales bacterium]|nr:hypothetical protein [Bacteroidales bacterium]
MITYFMGIALLAVVAVPVAMLNYTNNKRNAKMKQVFTDLSRFAHIDCREQWNGHLVALDEVGKRFYAVFQQEDFCFTCVIDLRKIERCIVNTINDENSSMSGAIDRVELVFFEWGDFQPSYVLAFYDRNTDGYVMNGELQTAERWKTICSKTIASIA